MTESSEEQGETRIELGEYLLRQAPTVDGLDELLEDLRRRDVGPRYDVVADLLRD